MEDVRTIDVTGDITEVPIFVFENKTITGSVVLTKVDKDNKTTLTGAEFIIKNENGEEIARGKTDESGVVKFTELPYGKYTYQEVTAPNGYVLDSKEYSFAITSDNEELNITVENEKITQSQTPSEPSTKPTSPSTTTNKPSNIKGTSTAKVPNTGDAGMVGFAAILSFSVGGLLINNRKKITG